MQFTGYPLKWINHFSIKSDDMKGPQNFPYKRLIIVAYRLPFKFIRKKNGTAAIQNSGGLVSAILSLSSKLPLVDKDGNKTRIVWVGEGHEVPDKYDNDRTISRDFDLHPVHIPEKINEKFYGGFCNDTIWPLFHYFPSITAYHESYFNAYIQANNLFYEQLKRIIQPGDFVWVHDYQLFLVPDLIRQNFPDITIGFFLHIPFPSYEIFRLLPRLWHNMILKGILGADIVGFHTKDYVRYFVRSVQLTLGYKRHQNTIMVDGRPVKAAAFPIGIDFNKFHDACLSPDVKKEKRKIIKFVKNKKLVFSVDRLDYTKGLLNRLRGIEYFLEANPSWHERVIFNLVVVPSRDTIERYKKMKKEIEATVGRINGKYSNLGWRPIIYQYTSLTFTELVALYDLSDAGLITPLRDGMNLVAKEYVACQVENKGVLILSEMTGASAELKEALIINPVDYKEMADAIKQALEMPSLEIEMKIKKMQKRIRDYDVFRWANEFFRQSGFSRNLKGKQIEQYVGGD
jgi:trehalose 6-phosphate synthase/phosphatase